MHTARIPPVDPAPATITAVLAMHAGHICPSSELLIRPRPSALLLSSVPSSPSSDDTSVQIVDILGQDFEVSSGTPFEARRWSQLLSPCFANSRCRSDGTWSTRIFVQLASEQIDFIVRRQAIRHKRISHIFHGDGSHWRAAHLRKNCAAINYFTSLPLSGPLAEYGLFPHCQKCSQARLTHKQPGPHENAKNNWKYAFEERMRDSHLAGDRTSEISR